jgi:hypothetical protein
MMRGLPGNGTRERAGSLGNLEVGDGSKTDSRRQQDDQPITFWKIERV